MTTFLTKKISVHTYGSSPRLPGYREKMTKSCSVPVVASASLLIIFLVIIIVTAVLGIHLLLPFALDTHLSRGGNLRWRGAQRKALGHMTKMQCSAMEDVLQTDGIGRISADIGQASYRQNREDGQNHVMPNEFPKISSRAYTKLMQTLLPQWSIYIFGVD